MPRHRTIADDTDEPDEDIYVGVEDEIRSQLGKFSDVVVNKGGKQYVERRFANGVILPIGIYDEENYDDTVAHPEKYQSEIKPGISIDQMRASGFESRVAQPLAEGAAGMIAAGEGLVEATQARPQTWGEVGGEAGRVALDTLPFLIPGLKGGVRAGRKIVREEALDESLDLPTGLKTKPGEEVYWWQKPDRYEISAKVKAEVSSQYGIDAEVFESSFDLSGLKTEILMGREKLERVTSGLGRFVPRIMRSPTATGVMVAWKTPDEKNAMFAHFTISKDGIDNVAYLDLLEAKSPAGSKSIIPLTGSDVAKKLLTGFIDNGIDYVGVHPNKDGAALWPRLGVLPATVEDWGGVVDEAQRRLQALMYNGSLSKERAMARTAELEENRDNVKFIWEVAEWPETVRATLEGGISNDVKKYYNPEKLRNLGLWRALLSNNGYNGIWDFHDLEVIRKINDVSVLRSFPQDAEIELGKYIGPAAVIGAGAAVSRDKPKKESQRQSIDEQRGF